MAQTPNILDRYPKRATLSRNRTRDISESIVHAILFAAAAVSILTTLGILASLLGETIAFFREVDLGNFFGSTKWLPNSKRNPSFGVWPLVTGTLLTSLIAMVIAVPLGLIAATYLSEFASPRARNILKPALELLAGVPTVVYGFFALTVLTPILKNFINGLDGYNALSAGLIMGVMITPLVSSLSEDAMSSVPRSLREGAYGLGATRYEVATKVVFPAALSGIVAAVILALSRAVGETMIVTLAAGQRPQLTADPRESVLTMTAYIVQRIGGEAPAGTLPYRTLFAVGTTLFAITFILNLFSHWFVRRFQEVYD